MSFTVDTKEFSQPIEFAFGRQVAEFSGIDTGETYAIVGIGDVLEKFTGPPLWRRNANLILLGRDEKKLEKVIKRAQQALKDLHGDQAGTVTGRIITSDPGDTAILDLPDDLKGIYVITPPGSHLYYVKRITAEKPGIPIALEKPITGTLEEARALYEFVQRNDVPIYGVDWTLLNAQPLFHALGMNVSYPDALEIKNGENFALFDASKIVAVDARDIESADNSLGDPTKVEQDRAWMLDRSKGGGVVLDMVTHMTNTLAHMGFRHAGLEEVMLGTPSAPLDRTQAGIYRLVADQLTGELYSCTKGFAQYGDDPRPIPLTIVSGKNGKWNHQFIRLTDENGYVLHWEVMVKGPDGKRIPDGGSQLDMYDPQGKIIASAALPSDCYVLAADEFSRYVAQYRENHRTPGAESSHFPAHVEGLNWAVAQDEFARRAEAQPHHGKEVKQLDLPNPPSWAPGNAGDFWTLQQ